MTPLRGKSASSLACKSLRAWPKSFADTKAAPVAARTNQTPPAALYTIVGSRTFRTSAPKLPFTNSAAAEQVELTIAAKKADPGRLGPFIAVITVPGRSLRSGNYTRLGEPKEGLRSTRYNLGGVRPPSIRDSSTPFPRAVV